MAFTGAPSDLAYRRRAKPPDNLDEEQAAEVLSAFREFALSRKEGDPGGRDLLLATRNLQYVLLALDVEASGEELAAATKGADPDETGFVPFDVFLSVVTPRILARDSKQRMLRERLDLLMSDDEDEEGGTTSLDVISHKKANDLAELLSEEGALRRPLGEEEVERMVEEAEGEAARAPDAAQLLSIIRSNTLF
eukprot:tig00000178_g12709.t1